MFFTILCRLAANHIKVRYLRACVVRTMLAAYIHHAIVSMILAVQRLLVAEGVKAGFLRAKDMRTAPHDSADEQRHGFRS